MVSQLNHNRTIIIVIQRSNKSWLSGLRIIKFITTTSMLCSIVLLLLLLLLPLNVSSSPVIGNGNVILGDTDYGSLNVDYVGNLLGLPVAYPRGVGVIGLRNGHIIWWKLVSIVMEKDGVPVSELEDQLSRCVESTHCCPFMRWT
jgi:hypothetical protein